MTDLYAHLSTQKFLKERFHLKKEKNHLFSVRAWADQMGLSSHGSLQQILAGKRTVPKKYIPHFVQSLGLNSKEAMYFETLVDFEKAKTVEERDIYYKRLTHLRPDKREVQHLELENFKYFQNPLHSIIGVMLERSDFKNDPLWIKENLRIKTTQREIKEVLERLILLGIITESNGKLQRKYRHVKNKIDTPSRAVREYHQKMSAVAGEEVKKQSIGEREYNSISFNFDGRKMEAAKEKIRNFVTDFIAEFESPQGHQTYQLNVQLFSLTQKKGDFS